MQSFLMTQSLLSSWRYLWTDFEKYVHDDSEKTAAYYEQAAFEDFLATLRREERPPTEAMQKGIDFENLVVSICRGVAPTDHKWYNAANEVSQKVRGGQFQVVASKNIQVAGIDFLLYGRLDCLKAGEIIDIKFNKYEAGKYFDSPQHPMYMELVPEANRFIYIASNGSHVWTETYTRAECRPMHNIIQEFVEYLQNVNLLSLYMKNWQARS